jgi:hypothetical protein
MLAAQRTRTGPFRAFGLVRVLLAPRWTGPCGPGHRTHAREVASTMTTLIAAIVAAVALLTAAPTAPPVSGSAAPVVNTMDVIPPWG